MKKNYESLPEGRDDFDIYEILKKEEGTAMVQLGEQRKIFSKLTEVITDEELDLLSKYFAPN